MTAINSPAAGISPCQHFDWAVRADVQLSSQQHVLKGRLVSVIPNHLLAIDLADALVLTTASYIEQNFTLSPLAQLVFESLPLSAKVSRLNLPMKNRLPDAKHNPSMLDTSKQYSSNALQYAKPLEHKPLESLALTLQMTPTDRKFSMDAVTNDKKFNTMQHRLSVESFIEISSPQLSQQHCLSQLTLYDTDEHIQATLTLPEGFVLPKLFGAQSSWRIEMTHSDQQSVAKNSDETITTTELDSRPAQTLVLNCELIGTATLFGTPVTIRAPGLLCHQDHRRTYRQVEPLDPIDGSQLETDHLNGLGKLLRRKQWELTLETLHVQTQGTLGHWQQLNLRLSAPLMQFSRLGPFPALFLGDMAKHGHFENGSVSSSGQLTEHSDIPKHAFRILTRAILTLDCHPEIVWHVHWRCTFCQAEKLLFTHTFYSRLVQQECVSFGLENALSTPEPEQSLKQQLKSCFIKDSDIFLKQLHWHPHAQDHLPWLNVDQGHTNQHERAENNPPLLKKVYHPRIKARVTTKSTGEVFLQWPLGEPDASYHVEIRTNPEGDSRTFHIDHQQALVGINLNQLDFTEPDAHHSQGSHQEQTTPSTYPKDLPSVIWVSINKWPNTQAQEAIFQPVILYLPTLNIHAVIENNALYGWQWDKPPFSVEYFSIRLSLLDEGSEKGNDKGNNEKHGKEQPLFHCHLPKDCFEFALYKDLKPILEPGQYLMRLKAKLHGTASDLEWTLTSKIAFGRREGESTFSLLTEQSTPHPDTSMNHSINQPSHGDSCKTALSS